MTAWTAADDAFAAARAAQAALEPCLVRPTSTRSARSTVQDGLPPTARATASSMPAQTAVSNPGRGASTPERGSRAKHPASHASAQADADYSPRTRPGRPSAILAKAIPTPRLVSPTARPIFPWSQPLPSSIVIRRSRSAAFICAGPAGRRRRA
jgi:hypothetical protein